jgi:sarcosine oxidase
VPDIRQTYDVIIVGCGAMGSAALCHLARQGKTVLGIDRHRIPNDRGSSHGGTRIIRLAYAEDPAYVPLLRRSYAWWRELERVVNMRLLRVTGSLDIGPADSWLCAGAVLACQVHDLPHALFHGSELMVRFPAYRIATSWVGLWQPDGGVLFPELCIAAQAGLAVRSGATILDRVTVKEWSSDGERVVVVTDAGHFRGRHLVLAGGPWIPKLVPMLAPLLSVERQVMGWFAPTDPALAEPDRFPVANLLDGDRRYATCPNVTGEGIKIMVSGHRHQLCDPDRVDRRIDPVDVALLAEASGRSLAIAAPVLRQAKTCLYTNTADGGFIVDRHPDHDNVVIVSACSGHGFKFCGAIADAVGDLVAGKAQRWGGVIRSLVPATSTASPDQQGHSPSAAASAISQ